MAVRNMEAINRQGGMIAQQQRNARRLREESFWNRVNAIRESRGDAVDFVDTVEALCKNGMSAKFEAWLKQQNVCYSSYNKKLYIGMDWTGKVYYVPKEDDVCFGWSDCGMGEYYSLNTQSTEYIVHTAFGRKRKYDEYLTLMAERLQPFLKAFFEWVETI